MALRCELLHDPKRGPGHGLLKVAPLAPAPSELKFSLMRNQGGNRYLGPEGRWQATVYEHHASAEASEGGVSVALGAWFVDAIIEQSPAVLYQLCVTVAAGKQAGSLRIDRQRLLGSKAESKTPHKPLTAPPAAVARAEPDGLRGEVSVSTVMKRGWLGSAVLSLACGAPASRRPPSPCSCPARRPCINASFPGPGQGARPSRGRPPASRCRPCLGCTDTSVRR
jgi:hypothetical protein